MRICNCILGRNGRCCQDTEVKAPAINVSTTTSSQFAVTSRQRVFKLPTGKWWASSYGLAPKVFDTWKEAMWYATHPAFLMNVLT